MEYGLIHRPHPRLLRIGEVLDTLPDPQSCDWHRYIPIDGDPLGNDTRRCCVEAAAWRTLQIWRAVVAGDTRRPTADQVLDTYHFWAGFDGTDVTDLGTASDTAAALWATQGLRWGDQLTDLPNPFALDPTNARHLRCTIDRFGAVQLDLAMLRAWDGLTTWPIIAGPDGEPNDTDRHRVCSGKCDRDFLYAISWGGEVRIPWDAVARYGLNAEGAVTRSWLDATGRSPGGLDLDALERISRSLAA